MTERSGHGPGVRFPPPLLFVAGFLVGWFLDEHVMRMWPTMGPGAVPILQAVGLLLVIGGLSLAFWGVATFRRAKTAIIPHYDASRIVMTGPYKFTRNPMYTGLTVAYVGFAALLSVGWPLLCLPFVLLALYRLVIAREESYLTTAFGEEYRSYQRTVKRWL